MKDFGQIMTNAWTYPAFELLQLELIRLGLYCDQLNMVKSNPTLLCQKLSTQAGLWRPGEEGSLQNKTESQLKQLVKYCLEKKARFNLKNHIKHFIIRAVAFLFFLLLLSFFCFVFCLCVKTKNLVTASFESVLPVLIQRPTPQCGFPSTASASTQHLEEKKNC